MNRLFLLVFIFLSTTGSAQPNNGDMICNDVRNIVRQWNAAWQVNLAGKKLPAVLVRSSFDSTKYIWYAAAQNKLRLQDEEMHVLEDGYVAVKGDYAGRTGYWYGYYPSGKPLYVGEYIWNGYGQSCKIGEWNEYYENGHLKRSCNYEHVGEEVFETDLYGSYKELYEDGTVAVEGAYDFSKAYDTVKVSDPTTGLQKAIPQKKYTTTKSGTWRYYNKDGTLKYKEDYP